MNVDDSLQFTRGESRVLMTFYKWDIVRLFEKFNEIYRDLFLEAAKLSNLQIRLLNDNRISDVCSICSRSCVDANAANTITIKCAHVYCKQCWMKFLTTKIINEKQCDGIKCQAKDCKVLILDEEILNGDDEVISKAYKALTIESFIQHDRSLRRCRAANCPIVVQSDFGVRHDITCACGDSFCFKCGDELHEYLTCEMVERWKKPLSEQIMESYLEASMITSSLISQPYNESLLKLVGARISHEQSLLKNKDELILYKERYKLMDEIISLNDNKDKNAELHEGCRILKRCYITAYSIVDYNQRFLLNKHMTDHYAAITELDKAIKLSIECKQSINFKLW